MSKHLDTPCIVPTPNCHQYVTDTPPPPPTVERYGI
jgi:hypothetical protein